MVVTSLLARGADANAEQAGRPALHWAMPCDERHRRSWAGELLPGTLPLDEAEAGSRARTVFLLLSAGAATSSRDGQGLTPLALLSASVLDCSGIAQLLVDAGAAAPAQSSVLADDTAQKRAQPAGSRDALSSS